MSLRILVVEDDPVSSDVLVSLLSLHGHAVDAAEDGFRAARMAEATPYDLVFVDYHLPEMDGYALARLLRSSGGKAREHLRLIALTGDRASLLARRGADALFDRILAKPIEPDALFALTIEVSNSPLHLLDCFLAEPTVDDAMTTSTQLWRTRGLPQAPAAAVLPTPSAAEAARLSCCFRLVDPAAADCFILLGPRGLGELASARLSGRAHLIPVFTIDPGLEPRCDALFKVGNGQSWSLVADRLAAFAARRAKLLPAWLEATSFDDRLLAFLFVADRSLTLRREPSGEVVVADGGAFAPHLVIESVRRSTARGLLGAKPSKLTEGGGRELEIVLTASGRSALTQNGVAATAATR